ncbi:hypothetical protein MG293_001675 [Ovis ammon polii]|uniref:GB1/RHD3-type G domain-containing protein n=1 Tax=Ovis ammon polii TaxID=230172 RepID=A0AAD4URH1_OVIAM|nr:hypothetical protein MG293_001675 [Ovis ammon polii]
MLYMGFPNGSAGFSLGSTMQSHTKGMWMWCVPHPKKPDRTLVLLDTEGLGDVQKGDNQNDSWIFALAILLSSTFVYNSVGTINQQAMDQLHYVTELTDRVRARSSPDVDGVEDSADFVSFFPDFVWTLRDFSLDLKADGESITADEYLENSLKLKKAQLDRKRDDFCNQNLKASEDHCSALLKDIFSPLEEDMKQGIYLKPGGYHLLMEKRQELKKKYVQEPRKGIQAEEILQEYLKSKESVTDVILQTDQTLSEKEKLIEGIDCDMVLDIEVFTILKGTDLVPLNLGQLEIVSSPLGLKIQSVKLKQQLYNLTSFVTCDIYFQRSFFRVKTEAICGKMREEQLQTAL